MFGLSAERNEVERTPRIAQCGHAPEALRGASAALSLCGIALDNNECVLSRMLLVDDRVFGICAL